MSALVKIRFLHLLLVVWIAIGPALCACARGSCPVAPQAVAVVESARPDSDTCCHDGNQSTSHESQNHPDAPPADCPHCNQKTPTAPAKISVDLDLSLSLIAPATFVFAPTLIEHRVAAPAVCDPPPVSLVHLHTKLSC
jgi:hypothetical protein